MTTITKTVPCVYVSGEQVEPGTYYDLQTGAILRMVEPGELPEGVRIVRFARRFYRLPEARPELSLAPEREAKQEERPIRIIPLRRLQNAHSTAL